MLFAGETEGEMYFIFSWVSSTSVFESLSLSTTVPVVEKLFYVELKYYWVVVKNVIWIIDVAVQKFHTIVESIYRTTKCIRNYMIYHLLTKETMKELFEATRDCVCGFASVIFAAVICMNLIVYVFHAHCMAVIVLLHYNGLYQYEYSSVCINSLNCSQHILVGQCTVACWLTLICIA